MNGTTEQPDAATFQAALPRGWTFRCFDLETTSVDVETCEVVQAAVVSAPLYPGDYSPGPADFSEFAAAQSLPPERLDFGRLESHSQLFAARDVPPESTAVHRITDRSPERFAFPVTVIPADAPTFATCVQSMVSALTGSDVVSVSFNGCGYDIPIIARFDAAAWPRPGGAQDAAARLRVRHIDVMRLWLRARTACLLASWQGPLSVSDGIGDRPSGCWPSLTADMFAGSLTAAHGFWLGEGFGDAHDAGVDCRATLAVLDAMLRAGFVDVETAIRWSNEPLPGDVDFDGKFKWQGDQAVIGFGKHAGTPLERLPASYLRWMLESDFPASTKHVVRRYLAGEYPARAYESE